MGNLKVALVALFVLCGIMLVAAPAMAETVVRLNQGTVQWTHDGTLANGLPIPTDDAAFFRLFIKFGLEGDPILVEDNHAYIPGTSVYEQTITISTEGRAYVGVQAIRWVGGDSGAEYVSETAWSHDPNAVPAGEDTWVIDSYYGPSRATDFIYLNAP